MSKPHSSQVGAKFKTRDGIEVTDAHSPMYAYRGTIMHEVTSIPSILPERLYEVAVPRHGSPGHNYITLKETQMALVPQITVGGPTPTSLTYTGLPDANDRCERVIGRDRSTTLFYSGHKKTIWDLAEEQAKKS